MVGVSGWLRALVGLSLLGLAWGAWSAPAEQALALRHSMSLASDQLRLPLVDNLDPYQSDAAMAPYTSIEVVPCGSADCRPVWRLSGVLVPWQEFEKVLLRAQGRSPGQAPLKIVLDSMGGDVGTALWLSEYVFDRGVATEVEAGGSCLSACVHVLSSSKNRSVDPWALVGVHQQNVTKSGALPVSVNAADRGAVKAYLEGEGTQPTVPRTVLVESLERAARGIQVNDAKWLVRLMHSGVSPALMVYAGGTPHTLLQSSLFVVNHGCAQALRLDNQGNEGAWVLEEVIAHCDPRPSQPPG